MVTQALPGQHAANAGALYREKARELAPLLRDEAAAIEASRALTPRVLDALYERDLLRVLLAPATGRGSVAVLDAARVVETLAEGDASTAWDTMAAMGGNFVTGFLPEETVARMFATPMDVAATAVGRLGKARAVEGGYLVEARWPFLSGSPHATWIAGLCMVHDGDQPRVGPDGSPHVVMPFLRKERVRLLDTWDAMGLRGTGSHEAEVSGAFVPFDETVDFANGPRPGLPLLYSVEEDSVAPAIAAAVAVGAVQGAIEAFRGSQRQRPHSSGLTASEAPLPQLAIAQAEASVAQARAGIYAALGQVDDLLADGQLPGREHIARTTLAATAATETVIAAASGLFRAAGSGAVFSGSPIERTLRDVLTLGAHRMVQRENYLVHADSVFAGPQAFGGMDTGLER